MAITRTTLLAVNSATSFGTGTFSNSITTVSDSVLVVVAAEMVLSGSSDPGQPTPSGGSLSYTQRVTARNDSSFAMRVSVFTAPVTTGATFNLALDSANDVWTWQVCVYSFAGANTTTPAGGTSTSGTTDIADGGETQTLSAGPVTGDETLAVIYQDCDGDPNVSWGTGFSTLSEVGAVNMPWLTCGIRTASTSTSVPVTDVLNAPATFTFKSVMCAVVIQDGAPPPPPPAYPFVVTSSGAAMTTNDPAVTFTGYTPVLDDLVVLYISSTTVLDLVVDASLPTNWFGLLGSGVDVNSDAHGMCAVYHFVTQAEVDAVTTTYTCTNGLAAAETGYVQGVVVRNVNTASPIDLANSTFSSTNDTPHVLASLTGASLSTGSLVVSSVARDATGAYTSGATGYTELRNDNTNNARWIGYGTALTVAGVDWSAQNITPGAGDEYISITAAFNVRPRPYRDLMSRNRGRFWLPLAARRSR